MIKRDMQYAYLEETVEANKFKGNGTFGKKTHSNSVSNL